MCFSFKILFSKLLDPIADIGGFFKLKRLCCLTHFHGFSLLQREKVDFA